MPRNDLADELRDWQNQFRRIVGDEGLKKWLKNAEFKKLILRQIVEDLLRRELPNFRVNKGFVLCGNTLSPCIDMIVYQGDALNTDRNDDFVIVRAEQVRAIILLMTTFKVKNLCRDINKLCQIKNNINPHRNDSIFAGLFALDYEKERENADFTELLSPFKNEFERKLQEKFKKNKTFVDCACFGKEWFMRKEYTNEPNSDFIDKTFYRFYPFQLYNNTEVSSYRYFIGNLRGHLGLNPNGYFSYPEGKVEAGELDWRIILERNKR